MVPDISHDAEHLSLKFLVAKLDKLTAGCKTFDEAIKITATLPANEIRILAAGFDPLTTVPPEDVLAFSAAVAKSMASTTSRPDLETSTKQSAAAALELHQSFTAITKMLEVVDGSSRGYWGSRWYNECASDLRLAISASGIIADPIAILARQFDVMKLEIKDPSVPIEMKRSTLYYFNLEIDLWRGISENIEKILRELIPRVRTFVIDFGKFAANEPFKQEIEAVKVKIANLLRELEELNKKKNTLAEVARVATEVAVAGCDIPGPFGWFVIAAGLTAVAVSLAMYYAATVEYNNKNAQIPPLRNELNNLQARQAAVPQARTALDQVNTEDFVASSSYMNFMTSLAGNIMSDAAYLEERMEAATKGGTLTRSPREDNIYAHNVYTALSVSADIWHVGLDSTFSSKHRMAK